MTEVRRLSTEGPKFQDRGTLRVAVLVDPADLATAIPAGHFAGADLRLHAGSLASVQPGAELLQGAQVLIAQVDPAQANEIAELQRVVQALAPMPVVAAVSRLTVSDARRVMRTGVSDVVSLPLAPDDIDPALEHARELIGRTSAGRVRQGRTVGFFKSVGGVGATALATQTGCLAPSVLGASKEVCLIDFDVQFGSAALQLDLKPSLGLGDLIHAGARLDAALLRSVVTKHSSGLNIISAPADLVPLDALNPDLAVQLLELATEEFDLVILDLPSAWTNWSLSLLARCDAACLVTELSVPSLKQARRQMDLLRATDLGELPLHVVANRIERGWVKTINLGDAEQVLRHKIDFSIANDFRTVSSAIDQGKMLSEIKAGSRVQRDLAVMVGALLDQLGLKSAG